MSVAFDTETFLIRAGLLAPPLVCLSSVSHSEGSSRIDVGLWHAKPEMGPLACYPPYGEEFTAQGHFAWLLTQDPVYGMNVAYDMCVCLAQWPEFFPQVFHAYDEDRVIDIALSQRLIDNSAGKMKWWESQRGYSLEGLARRLLDKDRSVDKGPDSWRLRYSELYDVPLDKWPAEAVRYALEDAQDTLAVGVHQWEKHQDLIGDSPAQARAAFALQLMMCWGIRTDPARIKLLKEAAEVMYAELSVLLIDAGLVRKDGTRNVRAAQTRMLALCDAEGVQPKLTKAGYGKYKEEIDSRAKKQEKKSFILPYRSIFSEGELLKYTSVDEDACTESGDDLLFEYSRRTQLQTILSTHVPDLLKGVNAPIQPSYKTLVESGRTSCAKSRSEDKKKVSPTNGFQFQNPKRSVAYFPPGVGVRECFIARPQKLFADLDFTGLELCTGAQACLDVVGYSCLAEAMNAGRDPHLEFGAKLMGISYEEALDRRHEPEVKTFRQRAKPPNFGLPGGLGVPGLMGLARGYGVKISREEAKQLIADWFEIWPEWREYFHFIRDHIDKVEGRGKIAQLRVKRIRGGVTYTSACNTLFQGLGADGAKNALYEVAKGCYLKGSVLYGARPVGFLHDEILAEVDENLAHEQAFEMARVMERACNVFLPDVPVKCDPTLAKRWSKDIEGVYDQGGRLQPWDLAKEHRQEVYYKDGARVIWK